MDWAVHVNDYEVAIGRAWTAVAAGELTTPVRSLLDAAAEAGASGSRFTQGIVLHEALRIGAQPRDVLDGLEDVVRDRRAAEPRRRSSRTPARSPPTTAPRSSRCRSRSNGTGCLLLAAEAAAEAAAAYRTRRPGGRAWTRGEGRGDPAARRVSRRPTPALANLLPVPALTRRELEVSRLAAGGLSNSSIADRLGVGVRTVEGHLLRAMTKLGVRSRADLGPALGEPEPA